MKGALVLLGLGAAAAVGLILFLRRKEAINVESGSTPLRADVPDGDPTGAITGIERDSFQGFTFRVRVDNPASKVRTVKVGLSFIPSGGIQFGVDPFKAEQLVTLPARASVGLAFIDDDLSFAPIASGDATLSIDGNVVDRK